LSGRGSRGREPGEGEATRARPSRGWVRVREEREAGALPLHVHPGWRDEFPWLVQGTTGTGDGRDWDLGLFGGTPVREAMARWIALMGAAAMPRVVHSRQVHRTRVLTHRSGPPGLSVSDGYDGHITGCAGVLLTVSVADCVPISMVDPIRRRIGLLHAGWRGTADGMVARGLARLGSDRSTVRVHLGPSICGGCYEVGPEVHRALGLPEPDGPGSVDLRAVQVRQALEAGVLACNLSVSEHCTRCGPGFFSHRAGAGGRQLGLLGVRP
jgi:polyphenol oxidase